MIFDHIGIIVRELEFGKKIISDLLPISRFSSPIQDVNLGVSIQFCFDSSNICSSIPTTQFPDKPLAVVW